jgi:hypothetical protein
MKNHGANVAHLNPDAHGWKLLYGGEVQVLPSLAEAAALVPPRVRLHLALPCQMAVLERLTFPATSRDELAGMAQLQLEKTLPYPVEEASSEMEVICQAENESTVLSIAVNTESLSRLCEPLRTRHRLPRKITLFAQHLAAACPAEETVLVVWSEQEHLALGIFENRKLSWAHTLLAADAAALSDEMPGLLLGAEMSGVPTAFRRVLLAGECAELEPALKQSLGLPVEVLSTETALPETDANLLPPSWAHETQRAERGEILRQRLMFALVGYLVLIAVSFIFLAFLKHRVQNVDAAIAAIQPKVAATIAQQKRWQALGPAIDPSLPLVEVLLNASKNRPNEDVSITKFQSSPTQFQIEGEAPNDEAVLDYVDKLAKQMPMFSFTSPTTSIVDEKHTKFGFFGKPKARP